MDFKRQNFVSQFLLALLLVMLTYNPSGFSMFHWVTAALFGDTASISPPLILGLIILAVAWTIYIKVTLRSLETLGLVLAGVFFAIMIWWLIDLGLLGGFLTYAVLFLLAGILAVGMSWPHIKHRLPDLSIKD